MPTSQGIKQVCLDLDASGGLSSSLISRIGKACDQVEDAGDGAILVLRALASGASEPLPAETVTLQLINHWERVLRRIERLRTMTAVLAMDAGTYVTSELLLVADCRLAAPHFRMTLIDGDSNVIPGMSLHRLANQIGIARARHTILFGEPMDAAVAFELGLIDELVPDLEAAMQAMAQRVAKVRLSEVAVRRQLLLEAMSNDHESALGAHLAAYARVL